MARASKAQHFAIYEDADAVAAVDSGMPTPDPDDRPSFEDAIKANNRTYNNHALENAPELRRASVASLHSGEEDVDSTYFVEGNGDADDERRESAFTSTSISSLPESAFETDYEHGMMHQPYTPPAARPAFRRPESVRRMQMASPTPSERSMRRSVLSPQRKRTPRSTRSSVKGSPGPRKRSELEAEQDKRDFPLVLLHVTLLPVELRWSYHSMKDILPAGVLESLEVLRSKVSQTIIQRGILIPHPREEYELLEERLLEALELRKERVTKCGHFRARESTSSTSSADSGVGSSLAGSDGELCETCHHHLKSQSAAHSAGAWSEMESVDVEILPWITDEQRRQLDLRRAQEDAQRQAEEDEEEARIREVVEEQVRIAHEERRRAEQEEQEAIRHHTLALPPSESAEAPVEGEPSNMLERDLPQVYQPKDIPLSLLLKNYIYLLAQDKRNIAIFALSALAFWLSLRAAVGPGPGEIIASAAQHGRNRSEYDVSIMSQMVEPTVFATAEAEPTKFVAAVEPDAAEKAASTLSPSEILDILSQADDETDSSEAKKAPAPSPLGANDHALLERSAHEEVQACLNVAAPAMLFDQVHTEHMREW